jgi:hypothetical protein
MVRARKGPLPYPGGYFTEVDPGTFRAECEREINEFENRYEIRSEQMLAESRPAA